MFNNIKIKIWIIFLVLSFFSGLYAKNNTKLGVNKRKMPVPEVDVYKVPAPKNIPVKLTYPARIKSPDKVTIVARVTGILQKKFFNEGDFVKKGDILYKIEPDIYEAEVESAKASLNVAIARFKQAEKDWLRAESSFKDNVISVEKRDNAKYTYETAKANILSAKATLKKAEINLNYTNVTAPISGFTGLKLIDIGNIVKPGTPLITITTTDPVYAEFSIPDTDILKSKYNILNGSWGKAGKSLKARLIINGKYYKYPGKINFVDVNISEKTSTVKMRAEFQNPQKLLMPGHFARIEITGFFMKNIVKVPQKAVIQNSRGTIVFIVKNGKASVKPIKLGAPVDNFFIVKKGLEQGDIVIVNNIFKVRPGAHVKIGKTVNIGSAK
jgi:membrane fusion protein (multidrug efflux system)